MQNIFKKNSHKYLHITKNALPLHPQSRRKHAVENR